MKLLLILPFLFLPLPVMLAQPAADTTRVVVLPSDSYVKLIGLKKSRDESFAHYDQVMQTLFQKNKLIDLDKPVFRISLIKAGYGKEFIFYLLATLCVILGLFKIFYQRYFITIFRVYLNTSLRQNQLTDILLQDPLASLIFNIFFCFSTGIYSALILWQGELNSAKNGIILIGSASLFVAILYVGKYSALKFIGWISNIKSETESYLFIVFLINKIIGIILLPCSILIAFCPSQWKDSIIIISVVIVLLLFMSRYIRSNGIQQKLTLSKVHFFIFILSFEILPILILLKFFEHKLTT